MVLVTYQENQFDSKSLKGLEKNIRQFFREHDAGNPAVVFIKLAAGDAYSAGENANISVVAAALPDGIQKPRRDELILKFSKEWTRWTGCHSRELLCTFTDRKNLIRYMSMQQARLPFGYRLWSSGRQLLNAAASKIRAGYFEVSLNPKGV